MNAYIEKRLGQMVRDGIEVGVQDLVGKRIKSVSYVNPWGEGLYICFDDSTILHITEEAQAGQISVAINGTEVQSDRYTGEE